MVASPKVNVIEAFAEIDSGEEMLAVKVLVPTRPVRTRSLNVATPELAALVLVPERVAPLALIVTFCEA